MVVNNVVMTVLYQVVHYTVVRDLLKDILPEIDIHLHVNYFMIFIIFLTIIPSFYKQHSKTIHFSILYPLLFTYMVLIFVYTSLGIGDNFNKHDKTVLFNPNLVIFRSFVTMYPMMDIFPLWSSIKVW